jgi:hypothetical protein
MITQLILKNVYNPIRAIYNLSQDELKTHKEYTIEFFKNGFIWHSKSSIGALIMFVKKKDGSLIIHVCQLSWLELTYHQGPISFTFDLKVVQSIKSHQSVHRSRLICMECIIWCIFEKVTNGKQHSKHVMTIWACCDCFQTYKCTCHLPTPNEQGLLWVFISLLEK